VRRTSHAQRPPDGVVCTIRLRNTCHPKSGAHSSRCAGCGHGSCACAGVAMGIQLRARAQGDLDGALLLLELAGQVGALLDGRVVALLEGLAAGGPEARWNSPLAGAT